MADKELREKLRNYFCIIEGNVISIVKSLVMKIINYTGNRIGNGGIESFINNISSQIKNDDKNVEFIVLADYREPNIYERRIVDNGGTVIYLSNKKIDKLEAYLKLYNFCRSNKDCVFWIHASFYSQYIYSLIAKISGIKNIVFHVHSVPNPLFSRKIKIRQSIIKTFLQFTPNKLVACSEYAGTKNFGRRDFAVVHNGFDCSKFQFNDQIRHKIRNQLSIGNEIVLGQVGRLASPKNQIFSVRLLKLLLERHIRAKLILVGDGVDEEELKVEIQKNGLTNDVFFVHSNEHVEWYYSAFDFLLFPSLYEGLGIVPIEAQCSGLNVLCSNHVPDEVLVTSLAKKISLSDIELWIDHIVKSQYQHQDRVDISNNAIEIVISDGYSSHNAYDEILTICKQMYGDGKQCRQSQITN